MVQKMNGLSRDFIIHPGETLQEILLDKGMSQRELSIRSGVSEKHVSTIIKGTKPISVSYAKKLEYALGIDASFWINLQSIYDKELLDFEEYHNISEEELSILKHLKYIIEFLISIGKIDSGDDEVLKVLNLRRILGVSSLTTIPSLTYNAAYRAQVRTKADVYVMFAWQKICEILTEDITVENELDLNMLKNKLPEIKNLMFSDVTTIRKELKNIFSECGIAFEIVKHFAGAPVQGFIKKAESGRIILCMTIRGGFADMFWFTLFHEIAHILNNDIKQKFIDFNSVDNKVEESANKFSNNILINSKAYSDFIKKQDFSLNSINKFAEEQKVCNFIIIGRLQHDRFIPWQKYSNEKLIYKWLNN